MSPLTASAGILFIISRMLRQLVLLRIINIAIRVVILGILPCSVIEHPDLFRLLKWVELYRRVLAPVLHHLRNLELPFLILAVFADAVELVAGLKEAVGQALALEVG